MATVHLKNIEKHYGTAKKPQPLILKGLDVEIQDGEFIVVVGPSGCGKSTFLRLLAGLEEVSSGTILIDGKDVTNAEPSKRDIAMVFQNYALYPHMTVRENMSYGVKLAKMHKAEIECRVLETAQMLGIEEHLDKKPHALSGGQRQRVAMGRAIVRKPKLFLFDEPLSNLDAKLRTSTRLEIRKRHNTIGITTLYVTHDQTEAMTLADHIIILNAGNIEQFATPNEIFHKPASTFVANFMGSPAMNLLPVQVDHGAVYSQGELLNGIAVPAFIRDHGQQDWILGIRPEHITVCQNDADEATVIATLSMAETLGSEQLLYCQLSGQELTVRSAHEDLYGDENSDETSLGKESEKEGVPKRRKEGGQIGLQFAEKALHWFDATTQKRYER